MEEEKAKKGKRNVVVFIIVVIVIAIIVAIGAMLYFRYKAIEEEKHRIAVETVDEVTDENLKVGYNKDYTNKDILLILESDSEYELVYKIGSESAEYAKYESPITITENGSVLLKYRNIYGTYSRDEYRLEINNIDKEKPSIVKKEASATTNAVTVNVEANDNIAVSKVEASIDGANYKEVKANSCVFEGLNEGTEYTVKLRAQDSAGNLTEDEVKATTNVTPKQEVVKKQTTTTKKSTTASGKSSSSSSSSKSSSGNSSSSGGLTKTQKEAKAREIAKQIAKNCTGSTQLEKVQKASRAVYGYYIKGVHKETGNDYYTAYGVFVLGESSCAGCCRALGMVLSEMGIKWKHINENKWTHQWLELTMDGQKGWADANVGFAGYGEWGHW